MTFKFPEIQTDIPKHRRPENSINAALHELPVRQKFLTTGTLVYLPRTGFIVTLIEHSIGGMRGVIVVGNETYSRGGYDIDVSDWEVQRAVVIPDGLLKDAALITQRGESPPETCSRLYLNLESSQVVRCALSVAHKEPLHVDATRQQWWENEDSLPWPWPTSTEPPKGVNVVKTIDDDGGRLYLHRDGKGWAWSTHPDRYPHHEESTSWAMRMGQNAGKPVVVVCPSDVQ